MGEFKAEWPVDSDGLPTEVAPSLLLMLCKDLDKLATLAHEEEWYFTVCAPLLAELVTGRGDAKMRGAFVRVDVKLLRLHCWGQPPPPSDPHDAGDDDRVRCELMTEDGTACGLEFGVVKGLAAYQRFATAEGHLQRCRMAQCCAWCMSMCSSAQVAIGRRISLGGAQLIGRSSAGSHVVLGYHVYYTSSLPQLSSLCSGTSRSAIFPSRAQRLASRKIAVLLPPPTSRSSGRVATSAQPGSRRSSPRIARSAGAVRSGAPTRIWSAR